MFKKPNDCRGKCCVVVNINDGISPEEFDRLVSNIPNRSERAGRDKTHEALLDLLRGLEERAGVAHRMMKHFAEKSDSYAREMDTLNAQIRALRDL